MPNEIYDKWLKFMHFIDLELVCFTMNERELS